MIDQKNAAGIGQIPDDWELVPLYELRNKQDRYSFTGGPFGSDLKSEHYTSSGIRVVQLQDIGEGSFLDKSRVFTSPEKADQLISCNIYPGEIILAKMAPVARCCKVPAIEDRWLMCSDGIRLSVDDRRYNNEFVFQALNSDYFRKEAEAQSTGTTRSRIGLSDLKLITLAIPSSIHEQQKIAAILSAVDEKIAVIDEQITQTQELKKGLMQRLLTKGIGHTSFEDSPLGEIPESWEVVKVGDLLRNGVLSKIQDGNHGELHPVSGDFVPDGIPFIMANCITKSGKLNLNVAKRISYKQYRSLRIGFAYPGDILLTHKGSIGLTATVEEEHGSLMLTPQVTLYRVGNQDALNNKYLLYYLQSSEFQERISKFSIQSTRAYIGILAQQNLLIRLPKSIDEQKQIATILATVDEKLDVLQQKKSSFNELKKGLMQQLLTGKIRVNQTYKLYETTEPEHLSLVAEG
jgi:type I restriction enzyme S subunit